MTNQTKDTIVSKKQFELPGKVDPNKGNKKDTIKSMTIKDNTINKLNSPLEHRQKETKQLLQE